MFWAVSDNLIQPDLFCHPFIFAAYNVKKQCLKGESALSLINVSDNELPDITEHDGKKLININIRYPSFDGENKNVCAKLSEFYADAAKEYCGFIKNKYLQKLIRSGNTDMRCGASMRWHVSFINQNVLSVLTDVYLFDGVNKHALRLAHNWRVSDLLPLPFKAREAFAVNGSTKRLYTDEICSKISSGEGGFIYLPKAEIKARKHFDFSKYYITPKGIAFYYEPETICAGKGVFPSFVMPFDGVEGLSPAIRHM